MRVRKTTPLMIVAIIICILMMTIQAVVARKIVQLDDQACALDLSKAVPNQLNYQGYLADAADSSAVSATLEMTFRLYDAEVAGSEQWSETHPAVEVENGLFQVLLGNVTPFPAGLFDGSALWLQTEVGPEALVPRKALVSVAYSQMSKNADHAATANLATEAQHAVNADTAGFCSGISAWTVDGDNVYRSTGFVGIGLASPSYTLHVNGVLGIGNLYQTEFPNYGFGPAQIKRFAIWDDFGGQDNPILGTFRQDDGTSFGELAFLSKAIGSTSRALAYRHGTIGTEGTEAWFLGSAGEAYFGGNVGIGTSTPGYTLDVNGDVNATTYWGDGSNLTGIAGAPDADWTISGSDMYSGVSGNVGIGTTTPDYKLHIIDDSHKALHLGTVHPNSNINILASPSGNGGLQLYVDGGANFINFITSGSEKARITNDGQVGIGTTSPTSLLDVAGNIQADSLFLGIATKAGLNGGMLLYNGGATDPVVELGHHSGYGGRITLSDMSGNSTIRLEPDVNGSGGFLEVERRNDGSWGFFVDGNSGGTEEPWVGINGSSQSVDFVMGSSGDASVVFPADAISAGEIKDEPGVSNSLGSSYCYLNSGNIDYTVDTVSITIPGPGYVEVTGGCYLNLYHSSGTDTRVFVNIDKTPANAGYTFPGAQAASIPDIIGTSMWQMPCTTTRLYEETTAGAKAYYLNADYQSGTSISTNVARSYMRAIYYPTLYGTLTLAESDGAGDTALLDHGTGDGTQRAPELSRRSISIEDHNARLETEMAALRAELEALKEGMQNQRRGD